MKTIEKDVNRRYIYIVESFFKVVFVLLVSVVIPEEINFGTSPAYTCVCVCERDLSLYLSIYLTRSLSKY